MADLKRIFKLDKIDENTEMWANFYKCGGDHEIQPYGSWAPIDSPTPDFHRPEAFGRVITRCLILLGKESTRLTTCAAKSWR